MTVRGKMVAMNGKVNSDVGRGGEGVDLQRFKAAFAERVKAERDRLGLSQEELARRVTGIARAQTANGWEKGTIPDAVRTARIAGELGVSVDYLLGLTDTPRPATESEAQETLRRIAAEVDRARHSGTIPWQDMTPEAEPED
jgi:transcriptional regulator with XRE-family HTH domain